MEIQGPVRQALLDALARGFAEAFEDGRRNLPANPLMEELIANMERLALERMEGKLDNVTVTLTKDPA